MRHVIQCLGRQKESRLIASLMAPERCENSEGARENRVISVDGQAVRATQTGDKPATARYALNVLDVENGYVLKQVLIGEKSNEITYAKSLFNDLDISGATVTADALNTQHDFAKHIIENHGDYCLALKKNQRGTYEEVLASFVPANYPKALVHTETDSEHGRIETRTVTVLPGSLLTQATRNKWIGLTEGCLVKIDNVTEMKSSGKKREETRYYLCSWAFDPQEQGYGETTLPKQLMTVIRNHWHVENRLHWVLDVTLNQDRTQCQNGDFLMGRLVVNKWAYNLMNYRQKLEKQSASVTKAECKAIYTNLSLALDDLHQLVSLGVG